MGRSTGVVFFVLIWYAKGDRSVYLSLHEHRK